MVSKLHITIPWSTYLINNKQSCEFLVVGCFKYASGALYDGQWEENIYMGDGTYKVCTKLYISFIKRKKQKTIKIFIKVHGFTTLESS